MLWSAEAKEQPAGAADTFICDRAIPVAQCSSIRWALQILLSSKLSQERCCIWEEIPTNLLQINAEQAF